MLLARSLLAACTAVYESDEVFYAVPRCKDDGCNHRQTRRISTLDLRKKAERSGVAVLTREATGTYQIPKNINISVFIADAKSGEDAELRAFYQLVSIAGELGADAIMEVKRSILTDDVATIKPRVASGGDSPG